MRPQPQTFSLVYSPSSVCKPCYSCLSFQSLWLLWWSLAQLLGFIPVFPSLNPSHYWHLILLLWIRVAPTSRPCGELLELSGRVSKVTSNLRPCWPLCLVLTLGRPPSPIFPGHRDTPLVGLLAEHLVPTFTLGRMSSESFIQSLLVENMLNKLCRHCLGPWRCGHEVTRGPITEWVTGTPTVRASWVKEHWWWGRHSGGLWQEGSLFCVRCQEIPF